MAPRSSLLSSGTGVAVLDARPRRSRRNGGGPPPPEGGGGGGGGDGADDAYGGTPGGERFGRFALALALFGITTLFGTLIAVALLLRRGAPDWRAERGPPLGPLWASSACLIASSLAVECAARRARAGASCTARRWLGAGLVLGVLFVLAQVRAWRTGWLEGAGPATGGYAAAYFALTGLHALHVLGGLLVLGALLLRAGQPLEAGAMGLGALYWHFMGALWLVLVALFLLGRYG